MVYKVLQSEMRRSRSIWYFKCYGEAMNRNKNDICGYCDGDHVMENCRL